MSAASTGPSLVDAKKKLGLESYPERFLLAAMGMEAEFTLAVDGKPRRPEEIFGDPRAFLGPAPMHRTGSSYHLPNGAAVYFDTGVIEVATPAMEIEPGCAARTGRSLWEGILEIRSGLDDWERREGRIAALVGFSAHYNISFEVPRRGRRDHSIEALALLLVHILPIPVMLLATNRRSTGVGVRPRGDRIEITVDFTPSPALMVATGTLIVGITRAVMRWPSFALSMLERMEIPALAAFRALPHTSRRGWLAHATSYAENPFVLDVDQPSWELTDGTRQSLRQIARRIMTRFRTPIRRISDPFSFRLIESIMQARAPSLLDLPDRPPAYEHVGRLCRWDGLFPDGRLTRSRYERVLIRAISGRPLRILGRSFVPIGMKGWSAVIFRPERGTTRLTVPVDALIRHLDRW